MQLPHVFNIYHGPSTTKVDNKPHYTHNRVGIRTSVQSKTTHQTTLSRGKIKTMTQSLIITTAWNQQATESVR